MKKVIKTIAKNTFFTTRLWIPKRVVLMNMDGTFNITRIGFGQRVMCQVKSSMRSPMPTLEYYDFEKYQAEWKTNVVMICSAVLGLPSNECVATAKQLLRKYSVDVLYATAMLDHFGDRITAEDLKDAGAQ